MPAGAVRPNVHRAHEAAICTKPSSARSGAAKGCTGKLCAWRRESQREPVSFQLGSDRRLDARSQRRGI